MIENFRTPDASGVKKSKMLAKGQNTPLDQLFQNAISIAHANSQIPNFYSNYATSPAFEYSFDKSYNQEKEKKIQELQNLEDAEDSDQIHPTPRDVKKMQQVKI